MASFVSSMGPVSACLMPILTLAFMTLLMMTAFTPFFCRSGRTAMSSRSSVSFTRNACSNPAQPVGKIRPRLFFSASAMLGAATPKATSSLFSSMTKHVSFGLMSGANFIEYLRICSSESSTVP